MVITDEVIKGHKQVYENSCIPMSVECVLKLLKLMPIDDFSLQDDLSKSGTSDWVFNGFSYPKINPKINFSREFLLKDFGYYEDRGDHFMQYYFDPLFHRIDHELQNERYVIISLESGTNQWHMEIVYDKIDADNYKILTFYSVNDKPCFCDRNLRDRVKSMKGTDILTYKWLT